MSIFLIMGVSGSGKSTLGQALAQALGCPYLEADNYHSPHNLAKMEHGVPLTDEDRWPWLRALGAAVCETGDPCVFGCSALKESYRALLSEEIGAFRTVFLKISKEDAVHRVASRQLHFMLASLVPNQFDTIEPPADALVLDAMLPVDDLVKAVLGDLPPRGGSL